MLHFARGMTTADKTRAGQTVLDPAQGSL